MSSADAIIKLRELVGDADVAMITTETPGGELHSRPLMLGDVGDDGSLAFLVDRRAAWVAGLRHGDPINVAVSNDDDKVWVSVAGTARIDEARAVIHRLWSSSVERYFPDGPDSPDLRVLTVLSRTAEYWDAPSSRVRQLAIKAGSLLGRSDPAEESGSIDLG